uniref:ACB domain-containing protein n=1 Tax=Schistosoma mansoni TaxID=6183 RepID=A0A5K4F4D1_SCHMA
MDITKEFDSHAEKVKKLKTKPNDHDLLELYALYKQATVGDNNTSSPGILDLKGKAKWNAWNGKKGICREEAKKLYVDKAKCLIAKHGLES